MMRVVQITLDEQLLARLDADPEARRDGRSAVLRRAAREYLRRKRKSEIAGAYARGYGATGAPELEAWAAEGEWPDS